MVAQIAGQFSPLAQQAPAARTKAPARTTSPTRPRRARGSVRTPRLPQVDPSPAAPTTPTVPAAPPAPATAPAPALAPAAQPSAAPVGSRRDDGFVLGSAAYAGFRAAYAVLAERLRAGGRATDLVAEVDRTRHLMWLIVDGSEHRSAERLMRRLLPDL